VKPPSDFIDPHVAAPIHARYLSHNSLTDSSLIDALMALIAIASVGRDLNIGSQIVCIDASMSESEYLIRNSADVVNISVMTAIADVFLSL
jgi:hypothetical protein